MSEIVPHAMYVDSFLTYKPIFTTLVTLYHRGENCSLANTNKIEPLCDKTNSEAVRPAKTQISLGIRPVW